MHINPDRRESIIVVDDFYSDPYTVREFALAQEFVESPSYHKGKRTPRQFLFPGIREEFERLLRRKITLWEEHAHNGVFQICTAADPIVYHSDLQTYAATIYLTPNAPLDGGLRTLRSRVTGALRDPPQGRISQLTYTNNLLDPTKWETVDQVGNVFNRLVIFDAKLLHAAGTYWGHDDRSGRLFQMFFFDAPPRALTT